MKWRILTGETIENCKSRNSNLSSNGFYIKKSENEFEENAIGTDEEFEFLQQHFHNTLDTIFAVVKKKKLINKAG